MKSSPFPKNSLSTMGREDKGQGGYPMNIFCARAMIEPCYGSSLWLLGTDLGLSLNIYVPQPT